jgi:hypothetical protein
MRALATFHPRLLLIRLPGRDLRGILVSPLPVWASGLFNSVSALSGLPPRSSRIRRPAATLAASGCGGRPDVHPWPSGLSGTSLVPSTAVPSTASAATKGLGGVNAVWASGTHAQSSMAERAFRAHWTTPRADRVPASRAAGCRERPAQAGCDSGRAPERPRLEGSPKGQAPGPEAHTGRGLVKNGSRIGVRDCLFPTWHDLAESRKGPRRPPWAHSAVVTVPGSGFLPVVIRVRQRLGSSLLVDLIGPAREAMPADNPKPRSHHA